MLALLLAWSFLAAATWPVGALMLSVCGLRENEHWLTLWAGLVAQAFWLQLFAFFFPIYPLGLVAIVVPALLALWLVRLRVPARLKELVAARENLIASVPLAIATAFVATSTITYYDTGLYHIEALRWLARYGLVPGLGLVQSQLATPSAWFALAAIFDSGPLQGRMASAVNGYATLLIAAQVAFALARIIAGMERSGDRLVVGALALVLVHAFWIDNVVSASPDLAVTALTVLTGLLIGMDQHSDNGAPARLAIVFAAGAAALKLSAGATLAIAVLYGLWRFCRQPARLIAPLLAAAIPLGISVAANVIATGCPAFPLSVACLDLPWTVPATTAAAIRAGITNFGRWNGAAPEGMGAWGWALPYFFHPHNRLNPPLLALAAVSALALILVPRWRRSAFAGAGGWVFALALCQILFVFAGAPDTRFAIGAIALLFGQAVAVAWPRSETRHRFRGQGPRVATAALLGAALVIDRLALTDRIVAAHWGAQPYGQVLALEPSVPLSQRWLLPPPLPVVYGKTRLRDGTPFVLRPEVSGDVAYGQPPIGDQCWGAAPLCTPLPAVPFRYRKPDQGLAGGFVRLDRSLSP